MMSATPVQLRAAANSPISKPRAVYSIDQILGTQHRRNNNNLGEFIFPVQMLILYMLQSGVV